MTSPSTPTEPGTCLCGCGLPVAPGNRFLRGHWNRIPPLPEAFRVAYDRKMAESTEPAGLCGCGCKKSAPLAKKSNLSSGWIRGLPKRWIAGHHGWSKPRLRTAPVAPCTCKCGCGGLLTERSKQGKFRLYLEGHSPKYARAIHASDLSRAATDAFWDQVMPADDGCWNWTGLKDSKGYGRFRDPKTRRSYRAHRLAHVLIRGPIDFGVQRNHHCDVVGHGPSCVNPWHGWLGTQSENLYDAAAKGFMRRKLSASNVLELRWLRQAGVSRDLVAEKFRIRPTHVTEITHKRAWLHLLEPDTPLPPNARRKLTPEIVRTIRIDYAAGATQPVLAARYGVLQSTISKIVLRKVWKHLESEAA